MLEKIAVVWITEKSLSKCFKNVLVVNELSELQQIDETQIYLKFVNGIQYEVYGNIHLYNKIKNNIKFADHYFGE